jgi:muramoyltetrapeptide carboxypeptidase
VILKPRRLRPGDTIAVIAPAGPVDPQEMLPGLEQLEAMGYRVLPAPHLYERKEYLAGEDQVRLEDLHAAFLNPEVRAVFCARGGYGTLRLLPRIRFSTLRRNPKILVGYSDITSLLLAVYKRTGLVTFHGPMIRECSTKGGVNLDAMIRRVSSEGPLGLDLEGAEVLRKGKAEGRLIGGNLSLLSHLVGTRYLPDPKGAILFLEDLGEPLYRIDRMITHLKLCGFLKGLAGIVAGRFEDCGDPSPIEKLLLEAVSDLGIPVLGRAPFGHGEKNRALPIGIRAALDTGAMTLTWDEPPVE